MAKAKIRVSDIRCNVCGAQVFVKGSAFNTSGGIGVVLRCGNCSDRHGNPTFIRNVNGEDFQKLTNMGRIAVEPLARANAGTTNSAVPPAYAGYVQANNANASNMTYPDSDIPLPPDPLEGSQRQLYAPSLTNTPNYAKQPQNLGTVGDIGDTSTQDMPPSLYADNTLPSATESNIDTSLANNELPFDTEPTDRLLPEDFKAVTQRDNPDTYSDCTVCKRHMAICVADTPYAMAISGKNVTYFDNATGRVLFTQHINYCPLCGGAL